MTTTTHQTQTKWKVEEYDRTIKEQSGTDLCIFSSDSEVARIKNPWLNWDEAESRARLIAQAPALLEMVKIAESTLQAEFATPDTREGRIAIALMNKLRTIIAETE